MASVWSAPLFALLCSAASIAGASATAPNDLSAIPEALGTIRLRWTNSGSGEDGFTVERSPAGAAAWTAVATPGAGATEHLDAPGASPQPFDYRVAAEFPDSTATGFEHGGAVDTQLCTGP